MEDISRYEVRTNQCAVKYYRSSWLGCQTQSGVVVGVATINFIILYYEEIMLLGTKLMFFGVDADWCSGGRGGEDSWFTEGSEWAVRPRMISNYL